MAAVNKTVGNKTATKSARNQVAAKVTTDEGDPRSRLLADVAAFNAWRRAHLEVPIDLTGADLRGANLRDALLAGAAMDGCGLDDAAMGGALLAGASLVGASLVRADLRGACFGRAELIDAQLAASPLGSALVRGASLRGASLEAARAQQAVFRGADLRDVDLTDCDLTDADLQGAQLDGARQGPPPPTIDDPGAIQARLGGEPAEVREGLGLFAVLMFLAGDRGGEPNALLGALGEGLRLSHADLQRMVPSGRIVLEALTLTPPASHWTRRVFFTFMCGMASLSASLMPMQLQVLGHFGAQLGLCNRAMVRIIGEELGVQLTLRD